MSTPDENESRDFIQIDHKNTINFVPLEDFKLIAIMGEYSGNVMGSEVNLFLSKVMPNYNKDNFTISLGIKKLYLKSVSISKKEAEVCINYFLSHTIVNTSTFIFSKDNIQNLGKLVVYVYKKLDRFKIKTEKDLMDKIEITKDSGIDVLHDYNNFVSENPKKNSSINKVIYWRQNRKHYIIPPELCFLLQYFKQYTCVEICLESYTKDELKLLMIIYLNFQIIFFNLKEMKADFSNEVCLYKIYERLQYHLNRRESLRGKFIKKINYKDEFSYKHRYTLFSNYIDPCEDDNPNLGCFGQETESCLSKQVLSDSRDSLVKQNEKTLDIIRSEQYLFEAILLTPLFITKFNKIKTLTLIFSDFFTREIKWFFKEVYKLNIVLNFHLLNTFTSLLSDINVLNLEFNSLNPQGFEKIIAIINKNSTLSFLRLSLFNSEVNYLPAGLFKLSEELKPKDDDIIFGSKNLSNQTKLDNDDSDHLLMNFLLPSFEENLNNLFVLLKIKTSLKEVSLILDSPSIISSNENYSMVLIKFFFNLLILLNMKYCQFKTFKFLSPYLIFDERRFPGLEDFLDEIDIQNNNKNIKNIHIHLQFYQSVKLTNLLSTNLQSLTLGDLDEFTFRQIVKFITKKQWRTNSELKSLAIGLLGIVTTFESIEQDFEKLVNIYIKNLENFNFYSHLIITKVEYQKIMSYLNYSWIKTMFLEINMRSRAEIQEFLGELRKSKNIKDLTAYFTSNCENKEEMQYKMNMIYFYLKKKVKNPRIIRNKICEFLVKGEKINITEEYN